MDPRQIWKPLMLWRSPLGWAHYRSSSSPCVLVWLHSPVFFRLYHRISTWHYHQSVYNRRSQLSTLTVNRIKSSSTATRQLSHTHRNSFRIGVTFLGSQLTSSLFFEKFFDQILSIWNLDFFRIRRQKSLSNTSSRTRSSYQLPTKQFWLYGRFMFEIDSTESKKEGDFKSDFIGDIVCIKIIRLLHVCKLVASPWKPSLKKLVDFFA